MTAGGSQCPPVAGPAGLFEGDGLRSCLPHAGTMSLLAKVLSFDEVSITCLALSHRDIANPLRHNGRLGAACGIEYAAQAMAVHGVLRLKDLGPPPLAVPGALVAVRSVRFFVSHLDDIPADLLIAAHGQGRDGGAAVYEFFLSALGRPLLTGRATVQFGRPISKGGGHE